MLPAPHSTASRRAFTVAALAFILGATAALAAAPRRAPAALPAAPAPIELFDGACSGTNPYFASTMYARGGERDKPAVVAFRNSLPDNPMAEESHPVLAIQRQVGATYGTGYEPESRSLFVAAFHKRGTPFGPGGTGGIYRIDLTTGNVALWLTVPGAGTDMHENRQDDYWPDNRARNSVGVTGLGDLDIGPGGRELYVMHLPERVIYRYNIADKKLLGKIPHGGLKEPWFNEARPFALAIHNDKLYHGVLASAYKSQEVTELVAHVYESELDGSGMREVLSLPMDYDRGAALSVRGPDVSARWHPWKDGYNDSNAGGGGRFGYGIYPMPMLTDIEFTSTENMVLGFRDRNGDMTFYDPGGRNPPGEGTGIPSGDIVLARRTGDTWTADPAPEYYNRDNSPRNQAVHGESSFGGLGKVPLADVVVMTGLAPLRISSGGGFWFDNTDGSDVGREELYDYESEVNFGKANGLGDVEVLCGPVIATPTPTVTDTATATDTPTITPTATDTATPRATDTATMTPTPRVYRIYLPFTTKADVCVPDAYHTDVVLVLDRSTSMLRSVEDGGAQKNAAAIAAAKQFVTTLDFTPDTLGRHDQVAVVGFNDVAWTELDLSNDPAAILGALDGLQTRTQEGTRLDLAMLQGQKPLDGPRHKPENRPVIILLTDGLPNRVPTPAPAGRQEDTVLAAATAAKARGTRVYTIALGKPTDIMPRLMWQMSSEKWMYYYVPRPEDLAGIYDQLAHTFDECGPHAWPTPTPCVADINHADIVLVLDMSTSMYRETSAGRSKQAAAIEAAKIFVNALDLEVDGWGRQDQAALVGFNGSGWIQVPMTGDREALLRGLDALPAKSAEGTRLDLAFQIGQQAMENPSRLPENAAVMIMLTDGLPNRVPTPVAGGSQEDTVRRAATAAKSRGTKAYTIGLGAPEDIDEALLSECASEPSQFYYAPDGEDLARIYREIAGRISACRPD